MAVETIGIGHAWTGIYLGWYATALALSGNEAMAAAEFDLSLSSLENYDGLLGDRQSLSRLEALIDRLDRFGLTEEAARYRALIEE